jgi:zinc finger protein
VTKTEDLNRDILKSETATILIPERELKITRGTLGGRFTTVEGLLDGVKNDLTRANPFVLGDSSKEEFADKYKTFLEEMDNLIALKQSFTIVMDDPAANSYVQNPYAPNPDPNVTIEDYERTFEQNEEMGINDMKTENYEAEHAAAKKQQQEDSSHSKQEDNK